VYTSKGAVEFLKECYERIPQRLAPLFVRADSGFFDGGLQDFLESRHSEYLTKVKMRNLVELLMSQRSWQREKGKTGIETVVFMYQLPHDEGSSPVFFTLKSPLGAEDELHFLILNNVRQI
jgi:hypothetical protein